jgi:peptide chain release factor subunit 1
MCVVFIERGEARLFELYQDEMREVLTHRDRTLRAKHMPAFIEARLRNKAEELTKRHFRDVIATLDRVFRTEGFDMLAIGGQRHEIPRFTDLLPLHLRDRVAGTFPVDKHPTGTEHIRRCAMTIMQEHEHDQQRRRVAEVVEGVAIGGRSALGIDDCLWAGVLAAVDALLVEDGAVAPGVVCDNCSWMAVNGTQCPQCGRDLRPVPDILDELVEAVIEEGGSVTHVQVPTELSKHLVGAVLRFVLAPRP